VAPVPAGSGLRDDYRQPFERFRYVDAAIKVVGVGSVGTKCFIALMLGEQDDPFFLQIKEARRSVLQAFVGNSPWKREGETRCYRSTVDAGGE
jgi:uncharacterized protein (DUF2252 family)